MNNIKSKTEPSKLSVLSDLRIIFSTILTDPGSSLAYGTDAVIAVTSIIIYQNYKLGMLATLGVGAIIMLVYFVTILAFNIMSKYHSHKLYGGGSFISANLTAGKLKGANSKSFFRILAKIGSSSLLADFPVTQAISLISGIEALYFIPPSERIFYFLSFLFLISFIQRYGLGKLSYFMIWPVLGFYLMNLIIQSCGIYEIFKEGWEVPKLKLDSNQSFHLLSTIFMATANGITLITGVEVGYSSVNIPVNKHKTINLSIVILFIIVSITYILQMVNFLGLGINQFNFKTDIPPVPIQIAYHIGGDFLATPFGILTAIILILAAQTSQTDFPQELLRASHENTFPKGIGDSSWRKTRSPLGNSQHGVYNPNAIFLLGVITIIMIIYFPTSHKIEGMYGLAVVIAMSISVGSFLTRSIIAKKISYICLVAFIILIIMFFNILYNKFFEGAWFVLLLMFLYLLTFFASETIYKIWAEKQNVMPLDLILWYPAFANLPVDHKNLVLVSKFHPGVILFLKGFIKSGHMPLVVHFQSEFEEKIPKDLPKWYKVLPIEPNKDTVSSIVSYVKELKPSRVHLIPLLISGGNFIRKYFFGNSMDRLRYAISQVSSLQVEYNNVRVNISLPEILKRMLPRIKLR